MAEIDDRRTPPEARTSSIGRCIASCVSVFLTQFALALIPRFFYASPLLIQLALSALVLVAVVGVAGRCRRALGVYASAPAFVVLSIVYIWVVYVTVVREAVPLLMDVLFHGEVAMLIIGLCSIFKRDPGRVTLGPSSSSELCDASVSEVSETSSLMGRVRYCRSCEAYIKGFDHHCPAFGNCIGQNNYFLFMALLAGFLITESSFVACSSKFASKSSILYQTRLESNMAGDLVIGGLLFSLLQLLWQGIFFMWHIYCICFNIRTDEWINWQKYPEFQHQVKSEQGQSSTNLTFWNPYDKGILRNIREFLS
ncbi:palmitoyltransferase ZDHHC12 isoform X2 [Eucalyptus grandis]|uniref:palmitoyltransferase ZDHHC12 isoform X2 n=1 Tax=Eucalyptus grandis TaxID=71139 RepID=UPI00192EACF1|nr:palmitoyltransferase ZDHHC12 isoform X2 [Eucalyptus grandis]